MGAEPRLDKQYQGPKQDQLVISHWNANCMVHKVTALGMVLASLQIDAVRTQVTKLPPKYKTSRHRADRHNHPIHMEARSGGLIIYICMTLAFQSICWSIQRAVGISSGNPITWKSWSTTGSHTRSHSTFYKKLAFHIQNAKQNSNHLKSFVLI